MSDAALAIWYCDDGHLQGTNVAICVEAFRGRGVKRLVAFLKKKGWPVKARVRKSDGMLYLYISGSYGRGLSSQMIRFWKTIAPYVPTCMRQKLPERFQHLADDVYWNTKVQPRAWADEVVEVEPLLRRANVKGRYVGYSRRKHKEGWPQYCLVVEGNHNFLAEGLVVSNCLYDRPVLGCNGFPVGGESDDTLLMHHSAFPGLSHNLQRVGTQFFCITPWKSEFRDSDDTPEALCGYNMKDTLVTARIREPLLSILKRVRGEETYAVDLKMAEAAERMYLAGVPVSREVNERLRVLFSDNMRNARKIIDEKADDPEIRDKLWERLAFEQAQRQRKGDPDDYEARIAVRKDEIATAYAKGKWKWSIGSSDHLAAYLKARGVPMFFRTDKGKTSTKKDILEQYHHVPEVAAIMTYRENQKVFSTFCYKLFDRTNADGELTSYGHVDENDRIHPRWSVHKITGRWGAEDPSCQNWPKADKKKGRPNLRSQVVRPPGRKLVGFDFAQLESRIIALMSGDLWLVTLFADGKDIHSEFARVVWADFDQRPADERKSLRDTVKRAEFGAFYGGAIDTLHKNISKDYPLVKLPDIARMVSMMAENMPGVTRWHNDLLRAIAKPPHEIRSAIYGRRRCFPLGNADMNDVYNFPCQSTGADIMDTGIIRIMPRLDKYDQCWPILNIHDALVFECWEEDAEALKADVIECFTQEHTINGVTVKFPIEADIGDTWAEV